MIRLVLELVIDPAGDHPGLQLPMIRLVLELVRAERERIYP